METVVLSVDIAVATNVGRVKLLSIWFSVLCTACSHSYK